MQVTHTINTSIHKINTSIRSPHTHTNNQKMRDAPMNYQLDQNRVFNYQRQPFFPLPSVKWVKTNGQHGT